MKPVSRWSGPSIGLIEQHHNARSLFECHLLPQQRQQCKSNDRRGKQVFYSAADEHIRRVLSDMIEHVAEPTDTA